ncbi:hypothetical protein KTD31_01765 [Burkholderia multivorans]|jgi:hypothetical protein|uniref:hypothetical protein n=1 Tax=Burkholderia multivorans TaxID=87883 RepID=UPI001C21F19C|nr:hypothetical protein [Burkholderia multivorans]MBU9200130.1 hypothetical protein [Burkholderia multivorans]MDN8078748.1 hypothetical protein [Burkholderia multivorans]
MIDFKKLNDPEWREQQRVAREAEQAAAEAHEKVLRRALNLCLEASDTLEQNERSLVRNCQYQLNRGTLLSEKQEKWLLDIEKKVRAQLASKISALVARCAKGDRNGEHLAYPRSNWPDVNNSSVPPDDYWYWVLRLVTVLGDEVQA